MPGETYKRPTIEILWNKYEASIPAKLTDPLRIGMRIAFLSGIESGMMAFLRAGIIGADELHAMCKEFSDDILLTRMEHLRLPREGGVIH